MTTATCRTDGCDNGGIPLDVVTSWDDDEGTHYVGAVVCGVCGQQITDLDPPLPTE